MLAIQLAFLMCAQKEYKNNQLPMDRICEKNFTTYDIFLSSTLVDLGFKIEALDRTNEKRIEFCFQREKGLDKAIQAYWAHKLRVEPQSFSSNLKNLKNRIYSN